MNATKIASGFAVTTLAAAVSLSASALDASSYLQVEDAAWAGGVSYTSTYTFSDSDGTTVSEYENNYDNALGNGTLAMTYAVSHSLFSGSLKVEGTDNDTAGTVTVSGVKYDDGTFAFGVLGETLGATATGMVGWPPAPGDVADTGFANLDYDAQSSFRFTAVDLFGTGSNFETELKDLADDNYGLSVKARTNFDGSKTSVFADYEMAYEVDNTTHNGEATTPFIGLAVTSTAVTNLAVQAMYYMGSNGETAAAADDTSYRVSAQYAYKTTYSFYGNYSDESTETDGVIVKAGAMYSLGDIQTNVDYFTDTVEENGNDNVKVTVAYSGVKDLAASASYDAGLEEQDSVIRADLGYTAIDDVTINAFFESKSVAESSSFGVDFAMTEAVGEVNVHASFTSFHSEETEIIAGLDWEAPYGAVLSAEYQNDSSTAASDAVDADDAALRERYQDNLVLKAAYSF